MKKLSVTDLDVRGERVFVRVDHNVPLQTGDGAPRVADDRRIAESLPTLRSILDRGGSVVAASHLGRPKGRPDPSQSLAPVARRLSELLGRPVEFAPDCVGPEASSRAAALRPGGVLLLENLRFHKQEEADDEGFARELSGLASLYVNDAFGSAHRAHASVHALARCYPRPAAGLLMDKELSSLGRLLAGAARPFVVIVGGAKVSDKLDLMEHLIARCDTLIVGGGMAFTFLRALGHEIGQSLVDRDKEMEARDLMTLAAVKGVSLLLPEDHMEAKAGTREKGRPTSGPDVSPGYMGLDIGPKTVAAFSREIGKAKTILWNGPMGRFEDPAFAAGTQAVARAVGGSSSFSVVGGGDSAAAVKALGMESAFSHISTGGGASLEFLSGKTLPGVAVLMDVPL
ncbi:MAG TPA: phosphoglycerate kinase [Candidatus Polarisedimenticolia bacterium]|nr:phosphoglycerate kinase [Candidatus Polarisedimenticolia bacterium]